jgi:signal transduction histidine kinase
MTALLFAQMLSAAGPAILVSCGLALLGIIGFFFVSYFAHCFLTVVIDTAAGVDEIRWPDESIVDWLTKPIYVLWILLPILFVPCVLLAATGSLNVFLLSILVLLWAVSPVMFISSLAAKSWLSLLYAPFLKRWARYFFAYAIFLLWSGVVTALGTAILVWSVFDARGIALGAIFLPILCLLYFRILGRYSWYVTTRRMRRARKKKPNPVKGLKVEALDPWAVTPDLMESAAHESLPQEQTLARDKLQPAEPETAIKLAPLEEPAALEDEWTPNKKPYGVMNEEQARASWVERRGTPGTDEDTYGAEEIRLSAPVSLWQHYADRAKKEEELREQGKSVRQYERPRKPPTLTQAMTREIISFLLYPHTIRAWINLAIFFGVTLAIVNMLVYFGSGIARA